MQHRNVNVHCRRKIDAKETIKIARRPGDRVGWNFELADKRVGRRKRQHFRREQPVGAGRDDDLILAGRSNRNQSRSGWTVVHAHAVTQVDAALAQQRQCFIGGGILADASQQCDIGSDALRGQRLIRAFAAREAIQVGAGYGFPRCRQVFDRRNQIEIDRADNNDGGHVCQAPKRASRSVKRS